MGTTTIRGTLIYLLFVHYRDPLLWNTTDRVTAPEGVTDRNRSTSWTGQVCI